MLEVVCHDIVLACDVCCDKIELDHKVASVHKQRKFYFGLKEPRYRFDSVRILTPENLIERLEGLIYS